jgi:hypothetical protein
LSALDEFNLLQNKPELVTVHIVLRKKPTTPLPSPLAETPITDGTIPFSTFNKYTEYDLFHFHALAFDEEEAELLHVVFERKKGIDNKIGKM